MSDILLASGLGFLLFLGLFYAASYILEEMRSDFHIKERLTAFAPEEIHPEEEVHLFHYQRQKMIEKKLHKYLSTIKDENWFQLKVYQSGLTISLTRLLLVESFVTFTFFLLSYTRFGLSAFSSLLFGAVVAFVLTMMVLQWLISQRHDKFMELLPTGLDIIMRAIKAGHSLDRSLSMVAKEVPDPVGSEFRQIAEQIEIGITFEDALRAAAQRVSLRDFHYLITALIIQRQTGGPLAEILESIIYVLHRRQEIRLKAKSISAEGRMTGIILGALPFVFWGCMSLMKNEYIQYFFEDPTGKKLLMIIIGLTVAQTLTIRWLVDVNVE